MAGRATQRRNAWAKGPTAPLMVLLSILLAGTVGGAKGQSNDDEYRVKAAFLFHFAQLVDWPPDTLKAANDSLFLCTLGDDPFQGALDSTIAGKAIGTRVVRIRHLKQLSEVQGCQILFLDKAHEKRIPMLLLDLRKVPVLTVGETSGFLGAGGMVCFLMEDDKIRFEINQSAAESAGLKIGSRLLLLAKNVVVQDGK